MTSTALTPVGAPAESPLTHQFCTFWLSGLLFGVVVHDVQEVLRHQPVTVVRRAPASVTGLINLRGQIVTAIDLRVRLGLAPRALDAEPVNVIVRSRGEVVSLLVDEIDDVIDTATVAPGAVLEPVPSTIPLAVRGALHGVVPLPSSIMLVLDAAAAADVSSHPTPGETP